MLRLIGNVCRRLCPALPLDACMWDDSGHHAHTPSAADRHHTFYDAERGGISYAGWEKSAHDSRVFQTAMSAGGLVIPKGYYYLADAGYTDIKNLLVPYRSTRYHLKEWGSERCVPRICRWFAIFAGRAAHHIALGLPQGKSCSICAIRPHAML